MHPTWAGDLFHYRQYTCFNAILLKHPTLAFSHRVQKSVLYICVSFSVLHIGLSLPKLVDLHSDFSGGRSGGLVFPSVFFFFYHFFFLFVVDFVIH